MSTATKKDLADDDFVPKNAETIVNPTIPGNYPYCRIRPFPTLGRNDYGPFNFVFLTVLIRGIPRVVANRGGWDPALLSAVSLLFDKMTSIIDDCRGRVNKILESGLLAVFPWGKDLSCVVPVVQPTFEEAIAAAQQAAWQIQRDYLLFVSNSKYNTDFLGGVSVVINFGEAYLSLLGNAAAYMDFTYIGTPITDMKDFGRSSKPGELWVLDVDGVSDDKFIGHEVSNIINGEEVISRWLVRPRTSRDSEGREPVACCPSCLNHESCTSICVTANEEGTKPGAVVPPSAITFENQLQAFMNAPEYKKMNDVIGGIPKLSMGKIDIKGVVVQLMRHPLLSGLGGKTLTCCKFCITDDSAPCSSPDHRNQFAYI